MFLEIYSELARGAEGAECKQKGVGSYGSCLPPSSVRLAAPQTPAPKSTLPTQAAEAPAQYLISDVSH